MSQTERLGRCTLELKQSVLAYLSLKAQNKLEYCADKGHALVNGKESVVKSTTIPQINPKFLWTV